MDLKQLAYFVQVAEFGSFTLASRQLSVVQPALSRQVRQLEVELHQPLFHRNGRGVTLTDAGRRLLDHARGILQQVERARTDLEAQRGTAAGQLAIGLPPSVGRTLTGPLVVTFRERFPKATLSIVEGLSANLLEWLALGRIDCAVVYNVSPSSDIELHAAPDEPLFLVRSRGGARRAALVGAPVSLSALSKIELVMPRRPHTIRVLLETALASAGLQPLIGMEIDSVPTILDLVARNAFSGVLSLNAIRSSGREQDFVLRPIGHPQLKTTMSIATSTRRPRGPLVERTVVLVGEMLDTLWAGKSRRADRPQRGRSTATQPGS